VLVRAVDLGVVGWMLRIPGPPHHVRHLIDIAKVVKKEAVVKSIERVRILPADFFAGDTRLLQEFRRRQYPRLQALCILGHPLAVEPPGRASELGGVASWR